MGKALGSNNLMVALFIYVTHLCYMAVPIVKVGKYADIAPQTSKMAVTLRDSLAAFWTIQSPPPKLPNEPKCRKTIPQGPSHDSCVSGA